MAQRSFSTHPLVLRQVQVRRIQEVTPRMRRITVGGEQLLPFSGAVEGGKVTHPAFAAPGFDDHVKLIFVGGGPTGARADADAGADAGALPVQLAHGIEWLPSTTRTARDYTPRRVGPDEFDLDFVLHGSGPAAEWASAATVGHRLWFVGPKSSTVLPGALDRILLVGDETALPAIGRFLDERPTEAPATVLVSIADRAAVQELRLRAGDHLEWLVADPLDGPALEAAVRRLAPAAWSADAPWYAWCAAESAVLLPVRRLLTRELSVPKTHLNVTGYWHRAEVAAAVAMIRPAAAAIDPTANPTAHPASPAGAEDPSDGAPDGTSTGEVPVEAPVNPAGWFVVRAAVRAGVLDALAAAPGLSAADLAGRVGANPERLGLLLPTLRRHGVIEGADDALRLGPFGDEIVDDEHVREEFDGLEAEALIALEGLTTSLGSGRPPWQEHHGSTVAERADRDPELFAELIEGAEQLVYLLDGFVADEFWSRVDRCVITGPGSAALATALIDFGRGLPLEILESAAGLTALRAELSDQVTVTWAERPPSPRPGSLAAGVAERAGGLEAAPVSMAGGTETAGAASAVAVSALGLAHRTDEEAVALLALLRGRADTAIVIESSRPDALGGADLGEALHHFAITGSPQRDAAAVSALATRAGWRVSTVAPLGWGVEAIHLTG
jgi:NADPH-dependent ferric siderophore reductase